MSPDIHTRLMAIGFHNSRLHLPRLELAYFIHFLKMQRRQRTINRIFTKVVVAGTILGLLAGLGLFFDDPKAWAPLWLVMIVFSVEGFIYFSLFGYLAALTTAMLISRRKVNLTAYLKWKDQRTLILHTHPEAGA